MLTQCYIPVSKTCTKSALSFLSSWRMAVYKLTTFWLGLKFTARWG